MEIRVFEGESQGNMYIVSEDENYIVIDPCVSSSNKDVEKYIKDKNLLGIFITHGHYDHFEKLNDWLTFNKPVYLHQNAISKLSNSQLNGSAFFYTPISLEIPNDLIRYVDDEDIISLKNISVKVYKFDGHTNCELAFLIENKLFSGDFIFEGGNIGRCDLPTGNFTEMQKSLDKLKNLSENLVVMSGHGNPFILAQFWKCFVR